MLPRHLMKTSYTDTQKKDLLSVSFWKIEVFFKHNFAIIAGKLSMKNQLVITK